MLAGLSPHAVCEATATCELIISHVETVTAITGKCSRFRRSVRPNRHARARAARVRRQGGRNAARSVSAFEADRAPKGVSRMPAAIHRAIGRWRCPRRFGLRETRRPTLRRRRGRLAARAIRQGAPVGGAGATQPDAVFGRTRAVRRPARRPIQSNGDRSEARLREAERAATARAHPADRRRPLAHHEETTPRHEAKHAPLAAAGSAASAAGRIETDSQKGSLKLKPGNLRRV